jgi:hypothetical protein
LSLNKKVTLQEVIGREYKKEVTALASEMAGGAKSGSQQAFGNYKKALKTFMDSLPEEAKAQAEEERLRWEAEGKPDEIKIRFVACSYFASVVSHLTSVMLKNMEKPIFAQQQRCNTGNLGREAACGSTTQIRPELNSMSGTSGSVSADDCAIIIRDISHDYNPDIGGLNILSFEEKFPEAFKVSLGGFSL